MEISLPGESSYFKVIGKAIITVVSHERYSPARRKKGKRSWQRRRKLFCNLNFFVSFFFSLLSSISLLSLHIRIRSSRVSIFLRDSLYFLDLCNSVCLLSRLRARYSFLRLVFFLPRGLSLSHLFGFSFLFRKRDTRAEKVYRLRPPTSPIRDLVSMHEAHL